MCTCFSGRCALSNYVTNRDANRGGCSQVCRFAFETEEDKKFTMATKDLNMANHIKDLIEIGVKSLKVEGRMRSLYYLATVIGTYRELIDSIYTNTLTEEKLKLLEYRLSRVANREVSTHYFTKEADETDQYYTGRQEISNQDYLGQVIEYDNETNLIKFYERNYFEVGDSLELFTPSGEVISFKVEKLFDENEEPIDVARHPDNIYYIYLDADINIPEYSMIRLIKKRDE
jgi:putative protease